MKSKIRKMIYAISAVLLMAIGSPSVNAASYVFSQGGFVDGGLVTGSFAGEDKYSKNNAPLPYNDYPGPDGEIYACSGRACQFGMFNEVTSFSIHYSGNAFFTSLNNTPTLSSRLEYDINAKLLKLFLGSPTVPINGYLTYNAGFFNPGGEVHLQRSDLEFDFKTIEPVNVTQVPLPGTLGFFISGLTWLGIFKRKNTV